MKDNFNYFKELLIEYFKAYFQKLLIKYFKENHFNKLNFAFIIIIIIIIITMLSKYLERAILHSFEDFPSNVMASYQATKFVILKETDSTFKMAIINLNFIKEILKELINFIKEIIINYSYVIKEILNFIKIAVNIKNQDFIN